METTIFLRRIRSFVRRDGRLTQAQKQALQMLWPHYGLSFEAGMMDYLQIFKREAPRVLEIGFGSGYSLFAAAQAFPDKDFIGIETHQPGIGALLLNIQEQPINNIRLYYADAVDVLSQCIPDNSLACIQLFFPDPWPKRKHHKRRLIQAEFVKLLTMKLKAGGELHLATDWEDYAKHMMKVLSNSELINAAGEGCFSDRSCHRPIVTKFEQRGCDLGHGVWELRFVKPGFGTQ